MRQSGKGLVKKSNVYLNDKGDVSMSHMTIKRRVKKEKENN